MTRTLLLLLSVLFVSPSLRSQETDPFGVDGNTGGGKSDWEPTHPDGDTPHERMLSLAYTDALPRFDRAELYALSMKKRDPFSDLQPIPRTKGETFPVKPYGTRADVHSHVSLTGDDCDTLRQAWQSLEFDRLGGAFCHDPVYGIRLYRNDALLFETTVCWKCQNFYVPRYDAEKRRFTHGWYGFANDGNAKSLLKLFQTLLPHPKL